MEFIEVGLPEPVGEPLAYDRKIDGQRFNRGELDALLKEIESELDRFCESIRRNEFSWMFYGVSFYNPEGGVVGSLIEGGCLLSGREGRPVESLMERYKESFRRVREEYEEFTPLNTEMCILAFRDTITKKVKARNPLVD